MPIDYLAIRKDAAEAIADAGQRGFLRRTVSGAGTDPWNPATGSTVNYAVTFVLTDYANRDRDGTLIQATDQQALIGVEGLEIEPTTADRLVDARGRAFEIVSLLPLEPGGVTIFYQAQVRR